MKNILQVIACVVLFGASAFCRKMSVDRLHPFQLQIVAGIVYALELPIWLYLLNRGGISGYDRVGVAWGVACLLAYVVAAVLFGGLLKSSHDPGVMTALVAMNPIVTMGLTVAFLGEEMTLKKGLATCLMVVGFVLFNLR